MIVADLFIIGQQVLLPVVLITWLAVKPAGSRVGLVLQLVSVGLVLWALRLAALWLNLPWWTPYLYLAAWLAVALYRAIRGTKVSAWLPSALSGRVALALSVLMALPAAYLIVMALLGRTPPGDIEPVTLDYPVGPGSYLVVNGGATALVNAHFLTLEPETDRQRAYRGQSYAVDLVKVNAAGFRASGWRPANPAAYEIFGEPVFAPCTGEVIRIWDGLPDMPVPVMDRTLLEGNHVLLACDGFAVLLAHLRQGSVRVGQGDAVEAGMQVGEVGNSGQSAEPHLHLHVQSLVPDEPYLAGEPQFLSLEGVFPVRNDRLGVEAGPQAGSE